jgi:NAD(P)H-dependent FMN reductase
MTDTHRTLLFIDGSLEGTNGNSNALAVQLASHFPGDLKVDFLRLNENPPHSEIEKLIDSAKGFVFFTGTYWDSWGSPLQRFLEEFTHLEGTSAWLGKPAAVLVTMHSVGGKGVLSRLQGVLNTLGLQIPPMSGMAYSFSSQLALETERGKSEADFWSPRDLLVIAENLKLAIRNNDNKTSEWMAWPVDERDPKKKWIASPGNAALTVG